MSFEETNAPDFGVLAFRFSSSQQWDRALSTAMEWLSTEPENVRAHMVAAQALVNLDRESEAQKHLDKALANDPDNDFAHRLYSIVHFEKGDFKAADKSIRRAIEINPLDAYHWQHLASMSYNQGDKETAKQCAEEARKLAPTDPNIQNLLIMCQPDGPGKADLKIIQYERALELDPENANIHNNIGVQYMDGLGDFSKAEEFFRKALYYNPSSKLYKHNLFIVLKHRDLVYRILCAPKDFFFNIYSYFHNIRKQSILLYLLLIPIWIFAFRFALAGLIFWFLLVWPMTKVYEFLTVGDIQARTGQIGARKGGLFGYRKWPINLRLLLFAICLTLFWGALVWLCFHKSTTLDEQKRGEFIGRIILVGFLVFIIVLITVKSRNFIKHLASKRRAKEVKSLLSTVEKYDNT